MSMPVAYWNGSFLPASQLAVSATDQGFVQGVTVAEQLRTFNGRLFRLEQHCDRLARSLEIIDVPWPQAREQIVAVAEELVARNYPLQAAGDDLGLSLFITPGPYSTFASSGYAPPPGASIGMHTYALPFHLWVEKYERGESLRVTSVRQVSTQCWPAELKCRSRMHYYLADAEARRLEPGSRALLLNEDGFVTESSTANLLVYRASEGLLSPPRAMILPGVTVAATAELAGTLNIPFREVPLRVDDVAQADEVLLCSTSPCVWSVTRLNGLPIGTGRPGPICQRLQQAWSDLCGVSLVAQAQTFASRPAPQ
jgi:branched-subunit amino acid aminotransferase/4-amino-4-deoxychorismate lyase